MLDLQYVEKRTDGLSMSGIKKKRFIVMLTPKDRYRHSHTRFRGEVISFVVQYETILEGEWFPVGRYGERRCFRFKVLPDFIFQSSSSINQIDQMD